MSRTELSVVGDDGPDAIFDVSIVLNLHDEARYLKRTLLSIEEAVRHAASYGIRCELVVVLDRPDELTAGIVDGLSFDVFAGHQVAIVEYGSAGLSRNTGASMARGEWLTFCDGDDLISLNSISKSFHFADASRKEIYIPEFVYCFGAEFYTSRTYGLHDVGALALFAGNPFTMKLFARREVLLSLPYDDTGRMSPFSHEDWKFWHDAVAEGYDVVVVPNTVLFYRRREDGMLSTHRAKKIEATPSSRFFQPDVFLRVCGPDAHRPRSPVFVEQDSRAAMLNDEFVDILHSANRIEAAIDYVHAARAPHTANLFLTKDSGRVYYGLCEQVGTASFSDVVLLPFLTKGGADKYILDLIGGLKRNEPDRKFLIVFCQKFYRHEWLDRLPDDCVILDLALECEVKRVTDLHGLLFRLIQARAPDALIHLKSSAVVQQFFVRFRHLLINKWLFYYFCENCHSANSYWFAEGYNFNFLSETHTELNYIVSDHSRNLEEVAERLDIAPAKLIALSARCDLTEGSASGHPASDSAAPLQVLWASRLDAQKRPELLLKIARACERLELPVHIEVYGEAILGKFDAGLFGGLSNLTYQGGFDGFSSTRPWRYDIYLYTAAFDGLPNVVLEALASGLPVIAPDIGGVAEVVTPATGFLVSNSADDDALVAAYIEAIEAALKGRDGLPRKGNAGRELIGARHSEANLLRRLSEIFEAANA